MSQFVDVGYAFGIHEGLCSLRKIKTEGSANVSKTLGIVKSSIRTNLNLLEITLLFPGLRLHLLKYPILRAICGSFKSLWPFFPYFSASSNFLSILLRDQSLLQCWIIPFGEWRPLSLHIYVDMDVHGHLMTDTPLLWSDTFHNEVHFNYLINTIFSCTQYTYS